jgi:hypothetical protein
MMENVSAKIDYLTITGKFDPAMFGEDHVNLSVSLALINRLSRQLFGYRGNLMRGNGQRFYSWTFRDEDTKANWFVSFDHEKQGWMVQIPGEALAQLDDPVTLVSEAVTSLYRITRIDFAFDVLNSGDTTAHIADAWRAVHGQKGKRVTSFINSATGSTFYIGSRQSEKMVRIYDKGQQLGMDIDWLRFELELKGNAARVLAHTLAADPRPALATVLEFIALPEMTSQQMLEEACDGEEPIKVTRLRVPSDREIWLTTQCLAAFKTLCNEDEAAAHRVLAEYQAAMIEARK